MMLATLSSIETIWLFAYTGGKPVTFSTDSGESWFTLDGKPWAWRELVMYTHPSVPDVYHAVQVPPSWTRTATSN